jgi:hypothetical protein
MVIGSQAKSHALSSCGVVIDNDYAIWRAFRNTGRLSIFSIHADASATSTSARESTNSPR